MDLLVWKSSFELGFDKIDQQHQQLLHYLNDCIESPLNKSSVFEDLKNYAQFHFSAEEKLLKLANFPDINSHQRAHQLFESQIEQLEGAGKQGDTKSIALLVSFLRDWFLNHVLTEDRRYADHISATMNQAEIADLLAHWAD